MKKKKIKTWIRRKNSRHIFQQRQPLGGPPSQLHQTPVNLILIQIFLSKNECNSWTIYFRWSHHHTWYLFSRRLLILGAFPTFRPQMSQCLSLCPTDRSILLTIDHTISTFRGFRWEEGFEMAALVDKFIWDVCEEWSMNIMEGLLSRPRKTAFDALGSHISDGKR